MSRGCGTVAENAPLPIDEGPIRGVDVVSGKSSAVAPQKPLLRETKGQPGSNTGCSYLVTLIGGIVIGACISSVVWQGMTRDVAHSDGTLQLDTSDAAEMSQLSQAKSAKRELELERELSEVRERTQQLSTRLEATLAELASVKKSFFKLGEIPREVSGRVITLSQSDPARCEARFTYPVRLSPGDKLQIKRLFLDSGEWQQVPGYMRIEVVSKNHVVAKGVGMVPRINDEVWYLGLDER
jgi:hypothetical protein